jgi:hypothetical protein
MSIRRDTADPGAPVDMTAWRLRRQRNCPLVKAACKLGDSAILAVVLRVHPVALCLAARRERAA